MRFHALATQVAGHSSCRWIVWAGLGSHSCLAPWIVRAGRGWIVRAGCGWIVKAGCGWIVKAGCLVSLAVADNPALNYVEVEVALAADACYRLLADPTRVPEWVTGVADVKVIETFDSGRTRVAQFISMPNRGSMAYRLFYDYDDATSTVRWHIDDTTLRDLAGEVSVTPIDGERCVIRYGLLASAAEVLPGWAAVSLREESPDTSANAFKRWAERQSRAMVTE